MNFSGKVFIASLLPPIHLALIVVFYLSCWVMRQKYGIYAGCTHAKHDFLLTFNTFVDPLPPARFEIPLLKCGKSKYSLFAILLGKVINFKSCHANPSTLLLPMASINLIILQQWLIVRYSHFMKSLLRPWIGMAQLKVTALPGPMATITRCDLSPRFFCINATLLCEFESDNIWINDFE